MDRDIIYVNPEWLELNTFEFKTIIMFSYLSSKNIFTGTIKTMCDFFGRSSTSKTIKKFKSAIETLEQKKYISVAKDGYLWIITLQPPTSGDIIIYKDDIDAIMQTDLSYGVADEVIIKLFVYLHINQNVRRTHEQMCEELGCGKSAVKEAMRVLTSLNFKNFYIDRDRMRSWSKEAGTIYKFKFINDNTQILME